MPGRALTQFIRQGVYEQKHPELLDLENNKITHIGIVPSQAASQIHHLNLKNNHIKSIEGIAQFSYLQSLDLSHNKISSTESLFELKKLFHLKRLYLTENPFLQKPLNQQILSFLGGFQNDLQILSYAFVNESREALIDKHKRSKSQSKSQSSKISANSKVSQNSKVSDRSKRSQISQVKSSSSRSQQTQIRSIKSMEINKKIQTNKANILLRNMKEFIEQGHQSQEMSSECINCQINNQESVFVQDNATFEKESKGIEITQMKKSTKFDSYVTEDKNFSEGNQTTKFQEESTGFKGRTLTKSKETLLDELFYSKQQSGIASTQQKFRLVKSPTNRTSSQDFRKFPSKQFKYQVDNLKIKMETESANMNCPSIIEKEDQDSYEIQFDFMSPERLSNKIPPSPKASPNQEQKQFTSSNLKILQDEMTLKGLEITRKEPFSKLFKPSKLQSSKTPSNTLTSLLNRKDQRQSKSVSKKKQKQNIIQNIQKPKQQLIFTKRGSLYQSTKHLLPQANTSTANQLIGKLLMGRQQKNQNQNDSISFSSGFSIEEMIQNGQKFERFYYNSLTKLKPVFNLLYSPFSSLKTDQKDMLLQELFKNHKQIFILFIRQYHAKQLLQDQNHFKDRHIESQHQEIQQLSQKIQFLADKLNSQNQKYNNLLQKILILETENAKHKKDSNQFNEILSVRQKIINDVKLEYQKAHKTITKKDLIIQKFLNQDQIEQQIYKIHQKNIKRQFLDLISKKASKVMKIHQFQTKKKQKQQRGQKKQNENLKILVFEAFLKNYNQEKGIKDLFARTNFHILNDFFYEWKIEAYLSRTQRNLQKLVHNSRKKQFLQDLYNFSLSNKRNRKIENFVSIRIKKKVLFQGFKKFKDQQKANRLQSDQKALNFNEENLLRQFFQTLKLSKQISNAQIQKNQKRIKPMIIKTQLNLLRNLVRFVTKQEKNFSEKVQKNVIKHIQSQLLIKIMKNKCQKNLRFKKCFKVAINYRLKKLFKGFKSITGKAIKKCTKMKPLIYKAAQQQRIKTLKTKFRQNTLIQKVQKQQKEFFFELFRKFRLLKTNYYQKQTELQCFLNFRRGFKAKNNFISALRHLNVLRKIKSKQITLSEHYQMQDMKYKEGHELNMFTLDKLKSQIATYLNEINFYKIQVQILAQRQQFLLDQKQNCLLQIQSREEENLELKTILIENEKKLNELEKKYEKSLDMYAAAMAEADQKTSVLQKGKSSFLYDTIAGNRSPATFRRDANQTTFTSLKR